MPLYIEPGSRYITVRGTELFSTDEVREHFKKLSGIIQEKRSTGSKVRILVDLGDSAVQPKDVGAQMASVMEEIFISDDVIAVVINSHLLKMQAHRLGPKTFNFFMSVAEAETYLNSH